MWNFSNKKIKSLSKRLYNNLVNGLSSGLLCFILVFIWRFVFISTSWSNAMIHLTVTIIKMELKTNSQMNTRMKQYNILLRKTFVLVKTCSKRIRSGQSSKFSLSTNFPKSLKTQPSVLILTLRACYSYLTSDIVWRHKFWT